MKLFAASSSWVISVDNSSIATVRSRRQATAGDGFKCQIVDSEWNQIAVWNHGACPWRVTAFVSCSKWSWRSTREGIMFERDRASVWRMSDTLANGSSNLVISSIFNHSLASKESIFTSLRTLFTGKQAIGIHVTENLIHWQARNRYSCHCEPHSLASKESVFMSLRTSFTGKQGIGIHATENLIHWQARNRYSCH